MANVKKIIDQLNKIDVKTIDLAKIQSDLMQRKDILIYSAMIIFTLFFFFNQLKGRTQKIEAYQTEITKLEDKLKIAQEVEKLNGDIATYVNSIPAGLPDVSTLISTVNELAIKHHIKILSFIPGQVLKTEFYKKNQLKLNISASEYANIGLFIHDLENSKLNILVDRWTHSTAPGQRDRRGRARTLGTAAALVEEENTIEVSLDISAINIELPKTKK